MQRRKSIFEARVSKDSDVKEDKMAKVSSN